MIIKIKNWNDQISEPYEGAGRRYGPNWSMDPDTLKPIEKPGKTLAMAWAIGDGKFNYPELRSDLPVGVWLGNRPNFGICMSGGGQRAATCALGWYRALNHLDLLGKARYLGCNSGATWVTLPLFCRQMLQKKEEGKDMDYDYFFGKYVKPQDLDFDGEPYGKIGEILVDANVLKYEEPAKGSEHIAPWSHAIDRNYVWPIMRDWKPERTLQENMAEDFWLDFSDAYLWNAKGTEGLLNDKTFPFPIFVTTVYEESNNQEFFPFDNTPLYSGIPVDATKDYSKDYSEEASAEVIKTDIKGGFLQSCALNANDVVEKDAVCSNQELLYFKEFENPTEVMKVTQITGSSSNFFAAAEAQTTINLLSSFWQGLARVGLRLLFQDSNVVEYFKTGTAKWWCPSSGKEPKRLNFVDGGLFDNLGALAVLRRGVDTILICNATDGDVDAEDSVATFHDIAALFGLGEPFKTPDWIAKDGYKNYINKRGKVFDEKEFKLLIDDMKKLKEKGKPLVRHKKLMVHKNRFAGILADHYVDVIFCFNGPCDDFDRLSKREADGWWPFRRVFPYIKTNFPLFHTFQCDYSVKEVNALSSICSYTLVEGLKNLEKLGKFDIDKPAKTFEEGWEKKCEMFYEE